MSDVDVLLAHAPGLWRDSADRWVRWECRCGEAMVYPDGLEDQAPLQRDAAKHVLAALRDAGWVDPEEAARLRTDLGRERVEHDETKDQRDALLPVVEAARALCAKAKPGRELHIDGPTIRTEFRALHAAVDALDQKAPETALSATQSVEEGADEEHSARGAEGATGLTGGGDG
jgi:hypothetical protein